MRCRQGVGSTTGQLGKEISRVSCSSSMFFIFGTNGTLYRLSPQGLSLLRALLTLDWKTRINAIDALGASVLQDCTITCKTRRYSSVCTISRARQTQPPRCQAASTACSTRRHCWRWSKRRLGRCRTVQRQSLARQSFGNTRAISASLVAGPWTSWSIPHPASEP